MMREMQVHHHHRDRQKWLDCIPDTPRPNSPAARAIRRRHGGGRRVEWGVMAGAAAAVVAAARLRTRILGLDLQEGGTNMCTNSSS